MRALYLVLLLSIPVGTIYAKSSDSDLEQIRNEIQDLKDQYESRIKDLESRLLKAEENAKKVALTTQRLENNVRQNKQQTQTSKAENSFNPAFSFILDGTYASYDRNPEDSQIPGFQLGGESALNPEGFSVGHTELVMSANIDDLFYGKLTYVLVPEEGETVVELEEAFFETIGLGNGWSIKGGRFFSDIGYLNTKHGHSWDFVDMPLVYRSMIGGNYFDDGLQVSWIAPFDIYSHFGLEVFKGDSFPAGGTSDDEFAVWTAFMKFGGDWGVDHSWQAGLSWWDADIENRQGGAHQHGGDTATEVASFTGNSELGIFDFVYKWAPNGNSKQQNFKFQFEYFWREETGLINMLGSSPMEISTYSGKQSGYYLQSVYQFKPQWHIGLRYDFLDTSNNGFDTAILNEAGLLNSVSDLERWSIMLDWSNSEFSRFRIQYSKDDASGFTDNQLFLQYIMSIGSHGAHAF